MKMVAKKSYLTHTNKLWMLSEMLKRKTNGQFDKAPIRVGDLVIWSGGGFRPGITKDKGYRVMATAMSAKKNKTLCNRYQTIELVKPGQFFIEDDDGEIQFCSLTLADAPAHVIAARKIFGEWQVCNV